MVGLSADPYDLPKRTFLSRARLSFLGRQLQPPGAGGEGALIMLISEKFL